MLILTRKPGETVVIGEEVRITVLAVRGSQIKLGIEAPREVRVNREEVLEREAAARPTVERAAGSPVEWPAWRGAGPGEVIEGGVREPRSPRPGERGAAPAVARSGRGPRRPRRQRERPRRDSEAA